ncbi:MAG: uracil-DNA glycosylase [Parachlamydiales bacterium]|nr:uracil-DNA glycosylase [Parachlamydiales bacterium]
MNIPCKSSSSFISKQQELEQLSQEIVLCRKCSLAISRNRPLVGDGNIGANIVMIGEAPGYYEDLKGKAFIGNAGKVLDGLLQVAGISRQDLYITNVLKCHPPHNRAPSLQEIQSCSCYLYRQLKILQPKVIITLGKHASKELFSRIFLPFSSITEMHGKVFEIKASYGPVKVIPLYHPSAACHNPSLLEVLTKDFETIAGYLKK